MFVSMVFRFLQEFSIFFKGFFAKSPAYDAEKQVSWCRNTYGKVGEAIKVVACVKEVILRDLLLGLWEFWRLSISEIILCDVLVAC